MLLNSANPHCVEKIVALSEKENIVAADDIVDSRGVKLWAKGKSVSRQLQEKLLQRKLIRPIESTLTIEKGIEFADVVDSCKEAIEASEVLQKLAGSREALGILADHRDFRLPGPVRLLLTAEKESGGKSYAHCVHVVALCAGLAARLQLSPRDTTTLLVAGVLHDLGEMYVNPEYLRTAYRLAPSEWKHVATHPRVGQILVQELTTLPPAVGLAVLQHHERLNGSGYPNQIRGDAISRVGALLGTVDSVAAIILRGGPGCAYRAGLALRIVPEEFEPAAAQTIVQALRGVADISPDDGNLAALGQIESILGRLEAARVAAQQLIAQRASRFSVEAAASVLAVLGNLTKAVNATGISGAASIADIQGDPELVAEVSLIVREIGWRLRNVSRNVFLQAETESASEAARLADLVARLDGSAA